MKSNSEKITLYPSNWLYNAGVVGFLRVLEFGGKEVNKYFKKHGTIEFPISELENFEIFYFEYVSREHLLQRFNLKELRDYINKTFNNKEKREIEIKIRELEIGIQQRVLALKSKDKWVDFVKDISELKGISDKEIQTIYEEIKDKIENEKKLKKLENVINKANKNIKEIYKSVINLKAQADYLGNFYFNKAVVANPKGEDKDRIEKFKERFIEPILRLKEGDEQCVLCGQRFTQECLYELTEGDFSILGISKKKFANFYNYYTESGYSYNRKCPICQLILLCVFAGFNRKPYQLRELDETEYIFVNYPSLGDAFNINNRLKESFKNFQFGIFKETNTYLETFRLALETVKGKSVWLLQNIYFAEIKASPRKDQTKPKFVYFNIDRALAEVFNELNNLHELFNKLSFRYEVYKNNKVYLSTEVLKRLIEKKPIIYIAFKMFSEKLKDKDNYVYPIWSLISLEFMINQKRRSKMNAKTLYGILKRIQEAGSKSFSVEEIEQEKRFRISQRFLTLIRGARKEDFYNELMRLFIVHKKPIPEDLFSLLTESDVTTFQEKALAFLTGFINPEEKKEV